MLMSYTWQTVVKLQKLSKSSCLLIASLLGWSTVVKLVSQAKFGEFWTSVALLTVKDANSIKDVAGSKVKQDEGDRLW